MKLEKFEKIDLGSFKRFQWDTSLHSFSGLNILLGWNGSGKTTLAKIVRSLEKNQRLHEGVFRLKFEDNTYTETSDTASLHDKIRIFNDDYVKEVLAGDGSIPHIFYLGKEAIDYSAQEKRLADLKKQSGSISCSSLVYDRIAQNTADKIKGIRGINGFKKELSEANYGVYNKADFQKRIEDFEKKITAGEIRAVSDAVRLDIFDLEQELLGGQTTASVNNLIRKCAEWIQKNNSEVNDCLVKEPVQASSRRISIEARDERDWIEQGVPLHFKDGADRERCLFCDSVIKNKSELVKHFSEQVISLVRTIDILLNDIAKLEDELRNNISFANESQKNKIEMLLSILYQIASCLRDKQGSISEKREPIGVYDVSGLASFDVVSDLNLLAHQIERHYVASQYDEYKKLRGEYDLCVKNRLEMQEQMHLLEQEVKRLKLQAQSVHEPATKLNNLFKTVFPYRNIAITSNSDDTGYALSRDGHECLYESLSEGERNFIALAYFVTALNDESNKFDDSGIVLIDDPVSSLDKNAIFQIFSLIAGEIERHEKRQYFILTHNLDFFGHLREHYRNKIDRTKTCHLYTIKQSSAGSVIEDIHKLLREHQSDYYYVASELHGYSKSCSIEDSYLVINLLRRWLETFLEFKFASSGDLRELIKTAYDEAKKRDPEFDANYLELYRFVNHASHAFFDTGSIDESILSGAKDRISEAFRMAELIDPLHYKKFATT